MKLDRMPLALSFALLTILSGAVVSVIGENSVQSDSTEQKSEQSEASNTTVEAPIAKKEAVTTSAANSCLSDPVVLNEISKKRQEIEREQKEIVSKEAELKNRETALTDELKKLTDLRDEISKLDTVRREANQEKVAKIVETLSTMSPKASAQMLTTLDDALSVAAISQMDTVKLAKIMNIIDPKRGAKLTELLAGVVRAQNSSQPGKNLPASSDAAATASSHEMAGAISASNLKKGENTNDNKNESIISGGPEQVAQHRTPSGNQTAEGP